MNLADRMGFGPKRETMPLGNGEFMLRVTPNKLSGSTKPAYLTLTRDQYRRFEVWVTKGGNIQDAFPDLSPGEREVILTGLAQDEWDRITKTDEED